MPNLPTGVQAPTFALINSQLETLTQNDFLGKPLVMLFFPFAFSSGCFKEMCMVRDNYHQYEELEAQVVGVSTDSPFTLRKFTEENNYPFPLLSDYSRQASKDYQILYTDDFKGLTAFSKRAAFILDKAGNLVYQELASGGGMPDFMAIKQALKDLK